MTLEGATLAVAIGVAVIPALLTAGGLIAVLKIQGATVKMLVAWRDETLGQLAGLKRDEAEIVRLRKRWHWLSTRFEALRERVSHMREQRGDRVDVDKDPEYTGRKPGADRTQPGGDELEPGDVDLPP